MKVSEFLKNIGSRSLNNEELTRAEALSVLDFPESFMEELFQAVLEVRRKYRGLTVSVQVLSSARNGGCTEDCAYCAQSYDSTADIDIYQTLDDHQLLDKADYGARLGAGRYCLGFSGLRFTDIEIENIVGQIERLKREVTLPLCCSIGFLTSAQALRLKAAGVDRINHNLNTGPGYYHHICSTHTYGERLENLRMLKGLGFEICSGGIVGLGESREDLVDMLFELRGLSPESVPINFLVPVPGTAVAKKVQQSLLPGYCLKVLALARLMLPQKEIRCAAGREKYLSKYSRYVFSAVDSVFASGYLNVGGQNLELVLKEIEASGFMVGNNS